DERDPQRGQQDRRRDGVGEVLDGCEPDVQARERVRGVVEQPGGDHDRVEDGREDDEHDHGDHHGAPPRPRAWPAPLHEGEREPDDDGRGEERERELGVGHAGPSVAPVAGGDTPPSGPRPSPRPPRPRDRIRAAPVYATIVTSTRNTRKNGSSSGISGASWIPVAISPAPRRKIPSAMPAKSHPSRNVTPTTVTI